MRMVKEMRNHILYVLTIQQQVGVLPLAATTKVLGSIRWSGGLSRKPLYNINISNYILNKSYVP